jgi:hypothetical protein
MRHFKALLFCALRLLQQGYETVVYNIVLKYGVMIGIILALICAVGIQEKHIADMGQLACTVHRRGRDGHPLSAYVCKSFRQR